MKNVALVLFALSVGVLAASIVGRVIGDPGIFMGMRIKSLMLLSSNLALVGLLADRVLNK